MTKENNPVKRSVFAIREFPSGRVCPENTRGGGNVRRSDLQNSALARDLWGSLHHSFPHIGSEMNDSRRQKGGVVISILLFPL